MKLLLRLSFLLFLFCTNIHLSSAQDKPITKEYKEQAIQRLSQLMNDFYIFPEVAKETEKHLLKQLKAGHFEAFENDETFAAALTESVQSINKDKHMRVQASRPYVAPENTPERFLEEIWDEKIGLENSILE